MKYRALTALILLGLFLSSGGYFFAFCPEQPPCTDRHNSSNPPPPPPLPPGSPGAVVRQALPAPQRPHLSIGIQPLIQSLQLLAGAAEPWEVWWSRNRDKYLHFREPVTWLKIVDTNGTSSVSVYQPYDDLIKILEDGLADKDTSVAFHAAIALGKAQDSRNPKLGSPKALETLKKAHETETRDYIKNNILLGLGLTGDTSCARLIIDILRNKKEGIIGRAYAAMALGYLNCKETIQALHDTVSANDDAEVKCSACLSLGNLGDTSAIPLLASILNTPIAAKKEISSTRAFTALGLGRIGGQEAVKELAKAIALGEKDTDVRAAIAISLGAAGRSDAREALLALLEDRNGEIRGYAALSLALIKDPKACQTISDVLARNKSADAEGLMILGLGLTGDENAKVDLRAILNNKKSRPLIKAAAAIGLGLLEDKEAAPIITALLSEEKYQEDLFLGPYLILSLGMINDQAATGLLVKIWQTTSKRNSNQLAYSNIAIALSMLGQNKQVLAQMTNQLKANDSSLTANIMHTLGLVSDRETARSFVDVFKTSSSDNRIRKATIDGVGFLLDRNDINPLVRIKGDNIDNQMQIMNYILPMPTW